jgi:unsaturated rhamnogalacturonyl hydrolase
MAESIVKRGNGMGHNQNDEPYINYEHGTFQHALWDMYTHTKNETYLSWIKKGIDNIVTPEGKVIGGYNVKIYTLDDIRVGESMIHLWQVTGEEKYKIAAGVLQKQMKLQPRTAEGAFWFVSCHGPNLVNWELGTNIHFFLGINSTIHNSNG